MTFSANFNVEYFQNLNFFRKKIDVVALRHTAGYSYQGEKKTVAPKLLSHCVILPDNFINQQRNHSSEAIEVLRQ